MRLSSRIRPATFSLILSIVITLTLPCLALGAARSFGGSGRFKAPRIDRQRSFSDPFHRFGFLGVGRVSEQPVIIIQQLQPAAATEPSEPTTNRVYVRPRWV